MLLQLGVVISSFNRKRLDAMCKRVAEYSHGKVEYYQSLIPLSTTFFVPVPGKKSSWKNANHLIVTKNRKKILEVFGNATRASGRLYSSNPELLNILAKYNVYSFESFKKYHPGIKNLMLFLSLFLILLGFHTPYGTGPTLLNISMSFFGSLLFSMYS